LICDLAHISNLPGVPHGLQWCYECAPFDEDLLAPLTGILITGTTLALRRQLYGQSTGNRPDVHRVDNYMHLLANRIYAWCAEQL
jgi:hypothetical protein